MKKKIGKIIKKKETRDLEKELKGRHPIQFIQLRPSDFKPANKKANGSKD